MLQILIVVLRVLLPHNVSVTVESIRSHSTPLSHGGASVSGLPSSSPAHPVSQSASDGSDDGSCKSSDFLS